MEKGQVGKKVQNHCSDIKLLKTDSIVFLNVIFAIDLLLKYILQNNKCILKFVIGTSDPRLYI